MSRRLKRLVINVCNQAWEFWLKDISQQKGIVVDEQCLTFITSNNTEPVNYESDENLSENIPDQQKWFVHWW